MHRHHTFIAIATAACLALGVAACGSDTSTSSSVPATTRANTSPDTTTPDTTSPDTTTPDATTPDTTTPDTTTPDSTTPDTTPPGVIEHPTGADEAVLRLGDEYSAPQLVIGGDGWVYQASGEPVGEPPQQPSGIRAAKVAPGAIPAPPAPTPFVRRLLTEDGLQIILSLADDKGLLQEQTYEDVGVTDMATTEITISAAGDTFVHSAYALGFDEETGNRKDLEDFLDEIADLDHLVGGENIGPAEQYVPRLFQVSLKGSYYTEGQIVNWPSDVPVTEGCVELPAERFDAGVAGIYIADIDGKETRVAVVPDVPGDDCTS